MEGRYYKHKKCNVFFKAIKFVSDFEGDCYRGLSLSRTEKDTSIITNALSTLHDYEEVSKETFLAELAIIQTGISETLK